MLLSIVHETRYAYPEPVFLGPHLLRLTPRSDAFHRTIEHAVVVDPPPAGRSENIDLDGNAAALVWFSDPTDRLAIVATSVVETRVANPFAFLLHPAAYPPSHRNALAPYLTAPESAAVRAFADRFPPDPVAFAVDLCRTIAAEFRTERRESGPPRPAETTLDRRAGSCRDLAVLYLEACRARGFAARFVSGYFKGGTELTDHELHAWVEIYLPGAGWRGFDPSAGLAVADRHVALAAGATPDLAAPVEGVFRGAPGRLTTSVRLTAHHHQSGVSR